MKVTCCSEVGSGLEAETQKGLAEESEKQLAVGGPSEGDGERLQPLPEGGATGGFSSKRR